MKKTLTLAFTFGLGFWLGGAFVLGLTFYDMSGGMTLSDVGTCLSWPLEALKYFLMGNIT